MLAAVTSCSDTFVADTGLIADIDILLFSDQRGGGEKKRLAHKVKGQMNTDLHKQRTRTNQHPTTKFDRQTQTQITHSRTTIDRHGQRQTVTQADRETHLQSVLVGGTPPRRVCSAGRRVHLRHGLHARQSQR